MPVSEAIVSKIGGLSVRYALGRLRAKLGPAVIDTAIRESYQDMILACAVITRALVAAKLGVEPDDGQIDELLDGVTSDPAIAARLQRLFVEGVKSPDTERRQLLALALLGFPPETPERDRIDAAMERLFPADVALLRHLVRLEPNGGTLILLSMPDNESPARFATKEPEESDHKFRPEDFSRTPSPDRVWCPDSPSYALQSAGCVAIGSVVGLTPTGAGNQMVRVAPLRVLPLGLSMVEALVATKVEPDLPGRVGP